VPTQGIWRAWLSQPVLSQRCPARSLGVVLENRVLQAVVRNALQGSPGGSRDLQCIHPDFDG
jgi:hypothetical protein